MDYYVNSFPVLEDAHIDEIIKLENLISKVRELIPPGGQFEVMVRDPGFIGFLDYLVPWDGPNKFLLLDFKYSNNLKRYLESDQLHLYKYWYEKTHPGCEIVQMGYLMIPKVRIHQKQKETLMQFRNRLEKELAEAEPSPEMVAYDPNRVIQFLSTCVSMVSATDYPKHESKMCRFCDYYQYCQKGYEYMILPENKRRIPDATQKKVIWVYGAPFSGKTFFANTFPEPLMLNTDGNIKFVDAPYISIRDQVVVQGRITKRVLGWEVFSEAVQELEKKQNTFKTIVVDLLEDTYEMCRVYVCSKRGWEHESDDSFKAWDMVTNEFLNTMKRLMSLDYENIVLISHEDRSRDVTKKTGDKITSIQPNLRPKVANKVAGMVDVVGRLVSDGDNRVLSFKQSEVIFGGGRLMVRNREITPDYKSFCQIYNEANERLLKARKSAQEDQEPVQAAPAPVQSAPAPTAPTVQVEAVEMVQATPETIADQKPIRRTRRSRVAAAPVQAEAPAPAPAPVPAEMEITDEDDELPFDEGDVIQVQDPQADTPAASPDPVQAEPDPAPMMGVNPPKPVQRKTRKKRGEN